MLKIKAKARFVPNDRSFNYKPWRYLANAYMVNLVKYIAFTAFLVLFAPCIIYAQATENKILKDITLSVDTIVFDTNSIVFDSFRVKVDGEYLDSTSYWLEPFRAQFVCNSLSLIGKTAQLEYRQFSFSFSRNYRKKDPQLLNEGSSQRPDPFKYRPGDNQDDLFGLKGLNKNGSISRGVLFGNNQDLAVNSTFNLELAGKLTEEINVVASVTDNTIPIQANGNTLELQDFDQVFIKVFDKRRTLVAGDMVLERPQSHFLNYFKKVQGISYAQRFGKSDTATTPNIGLRGAISKGKFARNQIQGIENNQGPYRLRGAANEQFIIVLSGTERVFIDGQELVRGQENDYIIDYNTAEVTFTAKRLITKDKRIVVEFQYSDRNYTRSLINASTNLNLGKNRFHVELYSEQDHKNQPFQQDLQDSEREILSNAGDNPFLAVTSGVDSVGADLSLVLYKQIDSLGFSPVYVQDTDPDSAFYRLTFSDVGLGNGDYVQDGFAASGRVFKWIAPTVIGTDTLRNGDHAPVRVLIAPSAQQLFVLGFERTHNEHLSISSELAYSDLDRNTFSNRDSGDDQGVAGTVNLEYKIPLNTASGWNLVSRGFVEFRNERFEHIERYRAVEFERNWNVLGLEQNTDQILSTVGLGLKRATGEHLNYSLNSFSLSDNFNGIRHELHTNLRPEKFTILVQASLLNTELAGNSRFLRHRANLKRSFKGFELGFKDEHELNERLNTNADSLLLGSYQFYDWSFFIQSPDTFTNKYRLEAGIRTDRALNGAALNTSTEARNLTASFELNKNPRNRIKGSFTLRQLAILNDSLTTQTPENTYLSRLEYDLSTIKGALNVGLFYELGAGSEQRREFIYVEVPAGQGVYVWNDYNSNGVRDLNEFEIAQFSYEANFIRVFIPTNDYVTTFTDQFSVSLDIRPRALWPDASGFKKFISKFNNQTALRNDRRTGNDLSAALDIFNLNSADTNLLSYNSSLRNSLYYDRTSRNWSADFTIQRDETKSNLVNGSETRGRSAQKLGLRWNISKTFTFNTEVERGDVFSNSDIIAGRTYRVNQERIEPKLTWQPNTRFRASSSFSSTSKNAEGEGLTNTAQLSELEARIRFSEAGKGSVEFTLSYIGIAYDGQENNSLGNEVLQGLRVGDNATWSLTFQRNLSKNLQADITYNGRKSEGNNTIHVGGLQLRAFF